MIYLIVAILSGLLSLRFAIWQNKKVVQEELDKQNKKAADEVARANFDKLLAQGVFKQKKK